MIRCRRLARHGDPHRQLSGTAVLGADIGALWRASVRAAEQDRHYFIAQDAYRGWALLGLILFPAMLLNIVLAILLRGQRPAFALAVVGCLLMAATLAVFFAWTYPANVATQNWTVVPANWLELPRQWEYSHAANAALNLLAFGCIAAAALSALRS